MPSQLLFTLICDDVRIESTNKLTFVGIYNYAINFLVDPNSNTTTPGAPLTFGLQKLCIVRRWNLDTSSLTVNTQIVGPSNEVVFNFETKPSIRPEDAYCHEIVQLAGIILSPGKHKIITRYKDGGPHEVIEEFDVRAIHTISTLVQGTSTGHASVG